jgi:hypothetical protein
MSNSKDYNHQYYIRNREELKKKAKIYSATHKERKRQLHIAWAKRNPERIKQDKIMWTIVHDPVTAKAIKSAIITLEKVLLLIE